MSVSSPSQLLPLKKVGQIVAQTIRLMREKARPGMTTRDLDRLAHAHFNPLGARSAPRLTYDFPGETCISVNDQIAHGIPGDRVLQKGDLVNVDVSLECDGYFA
ncbi:MAG: M24 family metallopeptidase, partial [Leptospiraceae bacterium]|nr:M24 family metallopeptidase [Leptospiraceae bacterium]